MRQKAPCCWPNTSCKIWSTLQQQLGGRARRNPQSRSQWDWKKHIPPTYPCQLVLLKGGAYSSSGFHPMKTDTCDSAHVCCAFFQIPPRNGGFMWDCNQPAIPSSKGMLEVGPPDLRTRSQGHPGKPNRGPEPNGGLLWGFP